MPALEILHPKAAAEYLKARYGLGSASTLAKLRMTGRGPAYVQLGVRLIAYRRQSLDLWAQTTLMVERRSTSEYGAKRRPERVEGPAAAAAGETA